MLHPFLPRTLQQAEAANKAHKLADFLTLDSLQDLYYLALSHWKDPSKIVLDSIESGTVRECITELSTEMRIEEAMMLTDLLQYLPDDILTKVDRASMAVSLEARVPLLDHRVVEFAWKLPLRLKISKGGSKWILREILYKYVPRSLIERPKMGFGVPIDRWLRGPLRDWAENLLSVKSLLDPGLFNVDGIREKWREHCSGDRNWQYLLWDVLVFQDWHLQHQSGRRAPQLPAAKELGLAKAGMK